MLAIMYIKECYLDHSITCKTAGIHSDVQCANNRAGVICGECAEGYSTIFGSLGCKKCTNTWLLLILAFAVAGILLVVLLFILNLTAVVDGDIYGFLLAECVQSKNISSTTSSNVCSYHGGKSGLRF